MGKKAAYAGEIATGTMLEETRKWYASLLINYEPSLTTPSQLAQFKDLPVIGGKDCEAVTRTPKHDEKFKIGSAITVTALHTPCHTQDSICWFMEDDTEKVVFTGDTLFIGGWYSCLRTLKAALLSGVQVAENSSRVHRQRCILR